MHKHIYEIKNKVKKSQKKYLSCNNTFPRSPTLKEKNSNVSHMLYKKFRTIEQVVFCLRAYKKSYTNSPITQFRFLKRFLLHTLITKNFGLLNSGHLNFAHYISDKKYIISDKNFGQISKF